MHFKQESDNLMKVQDNEMDVTFEAERSNSANNFYTSVSIVWKQCYEIF
jgi:hypothetical protein